MTSEEALDEWLGKKQQDEWIAKKAQQGMNQYNYVEDSKRSYIKMEEKEKQKSEDFMRLFGVLFPKENCSKPKKVIELKKQRKTIVVFQDGTSQSVTCSKEDEYDPKIGFALAYVYHLWGGRKPFDTQFGILEAETRLEKKGKKKGKKK